MKLKPDHRPTRAVPHGHRRCAVNAAAVVLTAVAVVLGTVATSTAVTDRTPNGAAARSTLASRFAAPPVDDRPAARYWVASGTGDTADVRSDINAMADNGIGKATYNDLILAQFYDPSKSFGSAAWSNKLRAALDTSVARGLKLDVLISPGWSASSSLVTPDSPGTSKVLGHGRSDVLKAGEEFSGQLPLSPLADGVKKRVLQGVIAVRCAADCTGAPTKLVRSSVVDLTDRVGGSDPAGTGEGLTVDWTAPASPAHASYLVLAFYSQGNALRPTAGIDAHLRNTYQVDHFSKAGAKALIDPWEDDVLDDGLRSLLRRNAGSMWLDSIELHDTNWTDAFMASYQESHGRSFVAGLPTVSTSGDGPFSYDTSTDRQLRSEWSREMTDLFLKNHIKPLRDWAHSLGSTLRYQSYISIGPTTALMAPEAWAQTDVPDAEAADSRAVAGVSAIAGKRVNSTECCAFLDFGNDSWRQRWPDMLFRINQSFSTGANEVEYHGYAQRHGGDALNFGVIPGATNSWPGWSPFVPVTGIGDSWDTRQPSWAQQKSINDYVGRNQVILREGSLRSDFAVYSRFSKGDGDGSIQDPSVSASGYTWGYLSDKLVRDATFKGGALYPEGPRYKALVLDRATEIPLDVAQRILTLARKGLPVVIIGDTPSLALETTSPADNAELARTMAQLKKLRTVTHVPGSSEAAQAALPSALTGLGVKPLAAPTSPGSLTSITRDLGDATATFLFNGSKAKTQSTDVTIAAHGTPYALDSWSGTASLITTYRSTSGRVTVPVKLAPGETTVVVVARNPKRLGLPAALVHLDNSDADVVVRDGVAYLRSDKSGTFTSRLPSGKRLRTTVPHVSGAIVPKSWKLEVESWEKPDTGTDSAKRKLAPVQLTTQDGSLPSWRQIKDPVDLTNISGLGTYSTTVDVGQGWTGGFGAYLDLGSNFQTYAVTVNGRRVRGASQIDPTRIDLGGYLKPGANQISIEVTTTLRNAIITQAPQMAGGSGDARQSYGLTGPVVLKPYGEVKLTRSR